MATPLDIVSGALQSVGVCPIGETPQVDSANGAFNLMNDMLDQWSNEKQMVFCVQEIIHELMPSKFIYQIGPSGDVNAAFTGSIFGNVLTVSALSAGALCVGMLISGAGVAAGTAITALGTATGGNGIGAGGTYYVNLAQTIGSISMTAFAPRPLRINSAFVRIVNSFSGTLDFPVGVIPLENYERIGIKTLPGPWPKAVYYQPSMPVGILNYWPNPSSGEVHLFCDTVLNRFATLNDTVTLPQGYKLAIQWNLAEILIPFYPATGNAQEVRSMIPEFAKQGRALIKRMNAQPMQTVQFDPMLNQGRRGDAGWIMHGGFL